MINNSNQTSRETGAKHERTVPVQGKKKAKKQQKKLSNNKAKQETKRSTLKESTKSKFKDEVFSDTEHCHNLIAKVHPNPEEDVEHVTSHTMLIATRVVEDIDSKVTMQGASFAQQVVR